MKYIARERNSEVDIITESSMALNFFYGTVIGRLFLKLFVTKTFSNLAALFMNSGLSKFLIKRFVNKNDINMFEYDDRKYKSYNDFFLTPSELWRHKKINHASLKDQKCSF